MCSVEEDDLWQCVNAGSVPDLQQVLKDYPHLDLNKPYVSLLHGRQRPLTHAASLAHHGMVEALIRCGARPTSDLQSSCLHAAIRRRYTPTIRLLLNKGADLNAPDDKGDPPLKTAIMLTRSESVVEMLLNHGASVNSRDARGAGPLHWACATGWKPGFKLLLSAGGDPTSSYVDSDGTRIYPLGLVTGASLWKDEFIQQVYDIFTSEHQGDTDAIRNYVSANILLHARRRHYAALNMLLAISQGCDTYGRGCDTHGHAYHSFTRNTAISVEEHTMSKIRKTMEDQTFGSCNTQPKIHLDLTQVMVDVLKGWVKGNSPRHLASDDELPHDIMRMLLCSGACVTAEIINMCVNARDADSLRVLVDHGACLQFYGNQISWCLQQALDSFSHIDYHHMEYDNLDYYPVEPMMLQAQRGATGCSAPAQMCLLLLKGNCAPELEENLLERAAKHHLWGVLQVYLLCGGKQYPSLRKCLRQLGENALSRETLPQQTEYLGERDAFCVNASQRLNRGSDAQCRYRGSDTQCNYMDSETQDKSLFFGNNIHRKVNQLEPYCLCCQPLPLHGSHCVKYTLHLVSAPLSLLQLSRVAIRRCLRQSSKHFSSAVKALPLPTILHQYILMATEI